MIQVSVAMSETMLFEMRGGVALLTFNRPERNNAMSPAMRERYFDLLEQCAGDPSVRAVVLTGAGKSFSVGADTQALQKLDPDAAGRARTAPERPVHYPLSIPKPIIGAINGGCAGVSFVHALCCDIRFAAAGAKMTTAFVRRGLIAEYGVSWLLPRLIGQSRALDLLLSGRVILAEEAQQLGLVNAVYPRAELVDRAVAYAQDLADNCSPASMAAIKSQVYGDFGATLDESAARACAEMTASFRRPDFKEGVASFVEKRQAAFPPLPAGSTE